MMNIKELQIKSAQTNKALKGRERIERKPKNKKTIKDQNKETNKE